MGASSRKASDVAAVAPKDAVPADKAATIAPEVKPAPVQPPATASKLDAAPKEEKKKAAKE